MNKWRRGSGRAVILCKLAGGVAFVLLCLVQPAAAARSPAPPLGYDVSYPQCGRSLPPFGAFALVGVNKGLPFSANPCLGTGGGASELLWAGIGAQIYANTADPGPALSSHWPNGQTAPQQCNTATQPGADTTTCAYDYGWDAAQDSYQGAVNAFITLGWAPPAATRTPVANGWWLDVETANSWEPNVLNNVAELQGEVDYLKSVGAATVGFYSPPSNWQTITGGTSAFAADPAWVPGASSLSDAQARCSAAAASGGPTVLVQFSSSGGTADLGCKTLPGLTFAPGTPTAVGVGRASKPIRVRLPQAATAPALVAFASTSTSARFAESANGPWNATVVVTVAAGAAQTQPVFYRNLNSGTTVIAATAAGDATATRSITTGTPGCTPSKDADRGFELALAHARTAAFAARLARRADTALRGSQRHALIERDGCRDFEVAVTDFRTQAAATRALHRLRRHFNSATIEKT